MGRAMDLVVNPAAGAGRAGRLLGPTVHALARAGFEVHVHRTTQRHDAGRMVRRLVTGGADLVGLMGGDGTVQDAFSGLLDDDGDLLDARHTAFALVPAGTGGDLSARTLGMPSSPAGIAAYLERAVPRAFDLGRLDHLDHAGRPARCLFANIASLGLGGLVDLHVARGPAWLSGRPAYFLATLRANLGWRNRHVRIEADGLPLYEGPVMSAAIANGRAFGGGMLIAPHAAPDDGWLEVVVLGDLSFADALRLSRPLYQGTHTRRPGVHLGRGRVIRVSTPDPAVLLDVDGEPLGRVPATFAVLPAAVTMLRAA